MTRPLACILLITTAIAVAACSFSKTANNSNQSTQSPEKPSPSQPQTTTPSTPVQAGDLQPGQASGTYTAKGEVVELKYAYAGRAERFGTDR